MRDVRSPITVDEALLAEARKLRPNHSDEDIVDDALRASISTKRREATDLEYSAYDRQPLSEPDAWGDLESFLNAATRARRDTD